MLDLGTRDALVQRARISEREASALFWVTVVISCVLAVIVAACGSVIGRFYGEPRLAAIVLVSSFTFVGSAIAAQHYALLRRAMKFDELGAIEVVAHIVGAAGAVLLAFNGFGYWALVFRPVLAQACVTIGVWARTWWVPSGPSFTPAVKEMLGFGIRITGYRITDFSTKSFDRVALGYRTGAAGLGYYQNALLVYENLLDVLVFNLHAVGVASLSKLRNDRPELRRLWKKALSTLAFYTMPAFGLLAVTSQDLLAVVLGKKWFPAGVLLSVIALRGIPHSIERTAGWLHVAAGRTDRWMKWGLFSAAAHVAALMAGLPFGAMGVAGAYALCMFLLFIPSISYAGRPLGIGAWDVWDAVGRQLGGAMIAVAVGFSLRYAILADARWTVRIVLVAGAYCAVYGILVVGLLRVRTPVVAALSLAGDRLPSRFLNRAAAL
jgi:PST family polysaccharide transporter